MPVHAAVISGTVPQAEPPRDYAVLFALEQDRLNEVLVDL